MHGHAKRTKARGTPHDWGTPCTHGAARTTANDHDGQARNATCTNGSSASQTSAELQVHSYSQEPSSSGDARADGCTRRSSSTTAGSAGPGPGASDCLHAGSCSPSGTEADAG